MAYDTVKQGNMVKQTKLKDKSEHRGLKLDPTDIENIRHAISIYDKNNPPGKVHTLEHQGVQYIEYCNIADHLRYMRTHKIDNKVGHKLIQKRNNFDVPIQLRLSVPPSLEAWLNKGYPTLFTDEVQTKQFLKAFSAFDLTK